MRRLQERFGAEFGMTPKAAARVRRFERSVPLVAAGRPPPTEVALRCGWSDHAHMDRDWRVFAGTTPSRWRVVDVLADGVEPPDHQS
jgi:AraC-like DNA-binding protein